MNRFFVVCAFVSLAIPGLCGCEQEQKAKEKTTINTPAGDVTITHEKTEKAPSGSKP